jgi:hypothetical protein
VDLFGSVSYYCNKDSDKLKLANGLRLGDSCRS